MVDIYERAGKAAEISTDIAVKGAGAAVGAIGASIAGGILERGIIGAVTPTSTSMTKFLGWVTNNVPKGLISYGAYAYKPREGTTQGDFVEGVSYGAAADVVFDSVGRAMKGGVPSSMSLASPIMEALGLEQHPDFNAVADRMNAILSQNSSLKRRIVEMGGDYLDLETPPPGARERAYEFTQPPGGYPGSSGRERAYEFTEPPVPGVVQEKRPIERRYQFTTPKGKVITGHITDQRVLADAFGFKV